MKYLFHPLAGVLALLIAGCGDNAPQRAVCGDLVCEASETADGCAEDCGCGNGIVNPGEDCDGTDLGTATCESVVQRGGTLACNADCTFDVSDCDEYMCGNGIAEPGEECDGADLGGATCASVGFSGGTVACGTNCRLDLAGCCNDFCAAANTSACVGDTIETCTMMENGCLGLEVVDCAIEDNVCDDSSGTATCTCVDGCMAEGVGRCIGDVAQTCEMQANGCLAFETVVDCGTTGQTCVIGPQGVTCTAVASGEDCFDLYTIHPGQNLVAWNAMNVDYMTALPSCGTGTLTGPDIVLAYTATIDGVASYSIAKEAGMRHVTVVSDASCGTVIQQREVSCVLDTDSEAMADAFEVSAGTTYYFYIRDFTTGTGPLPSPLLVDLEEAACEALVNTASNLSPANGATVMTSSAPISFELQYPIDTSTGVITVTGDGGTSRSYDLSTSPSAVTFSNGGRTVQIASAAFQPGETLTVTWSGLIDRTCGLPVAPPTWTFTLGTPSCTPGTGGMVGTTVTRRSTGLTTLTEQYVAVDDAPDGYVYFGGQTELYRMPKAGGALENVTSAAVLGSAHLGYAVVIVGSRIFSLDTTTSTTADFLWRLSTSGGVTWNPLGYGRYPITPGAGSRAMFHHGGRIYIVTKETTAGQATEIWSVSANAVLLPEAAVREGTLPDVNDCDGITGDDHYFYLTCNDSNNHLIRVNRSTFEHELITDAIPLDTLKNEVHADDFDGDGDADALYVKSDDETVHYVCDPSGTGPFWHDMLVDFGGATVSSNYGLGFDPVANTLWAFDDDNRELVIIQ